MKIDTKVPAKVQRTVISIIILFFLAMQGSATFLVENLRFNSYFFPFVNYPMYDEYISEGTHVRVKVIVVGKLDDNREVEIQKQDLGLNYWQFRKGFVKSIMDGNQEEIIKYLQTYNGADWRHFTTVTVKSLPVIIDREGVRLGSLEVLRTVELAPIKEGNS